jgi:hypothetical protein
VRKVSAMVPFKTWPRYMWVHQKYSLLDILNFLLGPMLWWHFSAIFDSCIDQIYALFTFVWSKKRNFLPIFWRKYSKIITSFPGSSGVELSALLSVSINKINSNSVRLNFWQVK